MKKIFLLIIVVASLKAIAQNDRSNDYNTIVWLQTFHTIKLDKKWSLHGEYQWRRTDGLKNWEQSLLRIGANYKINDNVIIHAGYAWAETFPYGKHPIAVNGTFPEHRFYEQLTLRQPMNKFLFTHRFRIEQRWLGRVKAGTDREIEEWLYANRFRYQFRTQYNFNTKWYAVAADEVFIGAGKNVGVNVFDQNRIFLLVGIKLNKNISIEGGYFNQTLEQGRRVNERTIIQRNNGFVVGGYFNW
jgi:hypothetical protein